MCTDTPSCMPVLLLLPPCFLILHGSPSSEHAFYLKRFKIYTGPSRSRLASVRLASMMLQCRGVSYNAIMDASVVQPSSGSPLTITCRTSSLVGVMRLFCKKNSDIVQCHGNYCCHDEVKARACRSTVIVHLQSDYKRGKLLGLHCHPVVLA